MFSFLRIVSHFRSIARSLDKIATLYVMEMQSKGFQIRDPNITEKDAEVEISYGASKFPSDIGL